MLENPSGSLSAGERLTRLENDMRAESEERVHGFAKVWKEISAMKVEAAKDHVKVAIIVGVFSAIGSALLGLLFSALAAGFGK